MAAGKKIGKWLAALHDEDPAVRREAAQRLARRGNREAVRPLCETLKDDNWSVRGNAAKALGVIGDPWAVEPLIAALSDKNTTVRRQAAKALGSIRDSHAVEALCEALGDKKTSVRENATLALQQIGVAVVPMLCQRLGDANTMLRYHATLALCQLYEADRLTTTDRILSDRHLTPQQRWQGLEAIRVSRPSRLSFGWIRDVHRFCLDIVNTAESTARNNSLKVQGARQLLEYMTLARPTERDFATEREMLLRAAQENENADSAETLLRGSDREEEELVSRPQPPIRRLFVRVLARFLGPR